MYKVICLFLLCFLYFINKYENWMKFNCFFFFIYILKGFFYIQNNFIKIFLNVKKIRK